MLFYIHRSFIREHIPANGHISVPNVENRLNQKILAKNTIHECIPNNYHIHAPNVIDDSLVHRNFKSISIHFIRQNVHTHVKYVAIAIRHGDIYVGIINRTVNEFTCVIIAGKHLKQLKQDDGIYEMFIRFFEETKYGFRMFGLAEFKKKLWESSILGEGLGRGERDWGKERGVNRLVRIHKEIIILLRLWSFLKGNLTIFISNLTRIK